MTVSKEWLDMALSAWTVEAARDTTGYGGEVLAALTELASRRAADEVTTKRTRADFLFPANPGSVEEAAFEFANARTEEYRREWWETLQRRLRAAEEGAVTVEGELTAHDWGVRLEAQLAPKDAEPILRGDDTTAAVTVTIRRKR